MTAILFYNFKGIGSVWKKINVTIGKKGHDSNRHIGKQVMSRESQTFGSPYFPPYLICWYLPGTEERDSRCPRMVRGEVVLVLCALSLARVSNPVHQDLVDTRLDDLCDTVQGLPLEQDLISGKLWVQ